MLNTYFQVKKNSKMSNDRNILLCKDKIKDKSIKLQLSLELTCRNDFAKFLTLNRL